MVEILTADFGFGVVAGMFASFFLAICVAQMQQRCCAKSESGDVESPRERDSVRTSMAPVRQSWKSTEPQPSHGRLGSVSSAVGESVSSFTGSDEYRFGDITRATVRKVGSKIKARKLILAPPSGEPEAAKVTYPAEMPSISSGVVAEEFQSTGFYETKKGRFAMRTAAELYQTEVQFAEDLHTALRLFCAPILPTFSGDERNIVFSNLNELAILSDELGIIALKLETAYDMKLWMSC